MNHQYIIIKHSGTESKKKQAHLHILANRISLSGELYRDNWIGKRATEAANAIAKERDFVQSQDIGKANKAEIKEAMNEVLKKLQGFDLANWASKFGKPGQAPENLTATMSQPGAERNTRQARLGKVTHSPISSRHRKN